MFEVLLKSERLNFQKEYRFHPKRKWRFDYAFPDHRIAVEIEGGAYVSGRHTRGRGYENDCEKYNAAQLEGWVVLRYTSGMIKRDPFRVVNDIKLIILWRKP